jgi:hypothetical protein
MKKNLEASNYIMVQVFQIQVCEVENTNLCTQIVKHRLICKIYNIYRKHRILHIPKRYV